jgi:hypothetical protein
VDARPLQPFKAEDARAIRERERHDDEIAGRDGLDVGADRSDNANLVAHAAAGLACSIVL